MIVDLFKLLSTYEFTQDADKTCRLFRIEIFKSIEEDNLYRARAWLLNIYNLYPTLLNTNESGKDMHHMHSSDHINTDITPIIADDPAILTGKHFDKEQEVIDYVSSMIFKYYK